MLCFYCIVHVLLTVCTMRLFLTLKKKQHILKFRLTLKSRRVFSEVLGVWMNCPRIEMSSQVASLQHDTNNECCVVNCVS